MLEDGKKNGKISAQEKAGEQALQQMLKHNIEQLNRVEKALQRGEEAWLVDDLETKIISGYMEELSKLSGHVFGLLSLSEDDELNAEVAKSMANLYAIGDSLTHVRSTAVVKFQNIYE